MDPKKRKSNTGGSGSTGNNAEQRKKMKKKFFAAHPQFGRNNTTNYLGKRGVLITCDQGKESRCKGEIIDLFNEVYIYIFIRIGS